MVHELAGKYDRPFRDWLKTRVRFCSSLVDRIVTRRRPTNMSRSRRNSATATRCSP